MNAMKAYWLVRVLVGTGVLFAVFVGVVLAGGGLAAVAEDMSETEFGATEAISAIIGGVFGALWDSIVASAFAGWVVWGDWRIGVGGPPIFDQPIPRRMFR